MEASIRSICTQVRRDIINMTADAGCGHPGGSLSIVEALVATVGVGVVYRLVDGKNLPSTLGLCCILSQPFHSLCQVSGVVDHSNINIVDLVGEEVGVGEIQYGI